MKTWILIFYMSTYNSTGGAVLIDGITSYEKCQAAGERISKIKKYDWHECVEIEK